MTSSSGSCCLRRLLLLLLLCFCCRLVVGWKPKNHHVAISPRAWGILRGGSTQSLDESEMMECFQEEVNKMRQEMKEETDSLVEKLRQEIMEARKRGALKQKNKQEEAEVAAQAAENLEEEDEEKVPLEPSTVDNFDLDEDFSEGLDDDLAPQQQDGEKVALFEEEETDEILVGDSDEEPDAVIDQMKHTEGVKLEDLIVDGVEETEQVVKDVESTLQSEASSIVKPKRKSKKKKKKSKNLVRPEGVTPKKKKEKKKSKKKKSTMKKKKAKAKLTQEKEAIHTALSSRTKGDNTLLLLKSSKMETLVKGVVLVVLLALAVLALRIVENSVTSTIPAAAAEAATK